MMKISKTDKEMVTKLQSGNLSLIADALKDFRTSGSVALIPYLFEIISSGEFAALEEEILGLISDIKDKKAAGVIADALQNKDYKNKTSSIVAACWQSSLDFSPHMHVFAEYFFTNDYQTAIEVFTVIEESLYNASVAQRKACLTVLENKRSNVQQELKPLYQELIKMVESSLDFTLDN
ncbi:MAG: hypothetical protein R6W78_02325 [Bacteroidales bacterium]